MVFHASVHSFRPSVPHSRMKFGFEYKFSTKSDMTVFLCNVRAIREHTGVQDAQYLGRGVQLSLATAQRCLLHESVLFFKIRKFSRVHLSLSLIFKKFY